MQTHNDIQNPQNTIRFFDNISYKFDLDYAQLGAELTVPNERLNSADRCQLQLWACDAPYRGDRLSGIKIAESTYIPAGQGTAILDNVPAMLPAGNRDFAMVMALVRADQNGQQFVEDYINFSQRQQFVQPRLGAIVQTSFDAEALNVVIDGIENPRDPHNVSGDLSLEIWATAAPYEGGSIDGIWLGGLNLGQLVGGESRPQDSYQIRFDQSQLHAGSHLVLMLREWSINGCITRDFRHLQLPSTEVAPAIVAPAAQVPATHAFEEAPDKPETQVKKAVTAKTAVPAVEVKTVSKAKKRSEVDNIDPAKSAAKSTAAASSSKSRKKPADVEATSVSVNTANADELLQVKGVSASVANNIVAQRPYEKLDDLLRVTGIGSKLLERIKVMLRL